MDSLKLMDNCHWIDNLYKKHLLTNAVCKRFFVKLSQWNSLKGQFETANVNSSDFELLIFLPLPTQTNGRHTATLRASR